MNFEECLIAYIYLFNNYIFLLDSRSKDKFQPVSFPRHLLEKRILKAMSEIVIVLQSQVFRGLLLPLTLTWIAVNSAGRSNFL